MTKGELRKIRIEYYSCPCQRRSVVNVASRLLKGFFFLDEITTCGHVSAEDSPEKTFKSYALTVLPLG